MNMSIGLGMGRGLGLSWASGLMPTLDLDFLTGTMPAGLTFTRASTATYIGSDGLLKTAAVDGPRLDYDPITLACKGLLIEGSRTNLLLQSEDFSAAVWTKVSSSTTANSIAAPDGTLTADKILEDAATGGHYIVQSLNFTAGTRYAVSLFIKSSGRTSAQLILTASAFTVNVIGAFDLTNGVAAVAGSGADVQIHNVGGGWYRCVLIATATTTAGAQLQIRAANTYSAAAPSSYTGDGTSGIYVWGAQIEAGAFPSSYIPTTTAAVTRAADVCLMTGTNFSRWFNPLEGTIVAEFGLITNGLNNTGGNAFPHVYDIDQTAVNSSGHILLASAGYGPGIRAGTESAGVPQTALTHAATLGTGAIMRHAYAYRTNDFAASLNGAAVQTDSLGILPSPDRLSIGSQNANGGNALDGHFRRIRDWPRRLPNARLLELTA